MLRYPQDWPRADINLAEYTRLADDGCPNCPAHSDVPPPEFYDFILAAARCLRRPDDV